MNHFVYLITCCHICSRCFLMLMCKSKVFTLLAQPYIFIHMPLTHIFDPYLSMFFLSGSWPARETICQFSWISVYANLRSLYILHKVDAQIHCLKQCLLEIYYFFYLPLSFKSTSTWKWNKFVIHIFTVYTIF